MGAGVWTGGHNCNPLICIPVMCTRTLYDPAYCTTNKNYPKPGVPGSVLEVPRGGGVGGSSIVNGMLYGHGYRRNCDQWAEFGRDGWSSADVESLFKRIENYPQGNPDVRDHEGLIHINWFRDEQLCERFIDAVLAAGAEISKGDRASLGFQQ